MKQRKNILVITYWSLKDALIQAYTLPYLRIIYNHVPKGSKIYLITFEQAKQEMPANELSQMRQRLRMQGIRLITLRYSKFSVFIVFKWIFYFTYMVGLILLRKIDYIHAWCTPAGSIAYILSKLTGKKLIIDSYEPHADAMVENKSWSKSSLQYRMLFYFERKLTERATIIISATSSMFEYAQNRYGVRIPKFFVKPACVDESFFAPKKRKNAELISQMKLEEKIICVYAGKFGGIYLSQEVFDFFKIAEVYWGDKFRCLILTSHPKDQLIKWAIAAGFDPQKMIIKFVPHENVAEYMGLGDFAITPVKPIPSKRYCTPIKDGEYWALGLPVVITKNISDDSDVIKQNDIGAVLEQLNTNAYLKACKTIDKLLRENNNIELQDKIRDIAYHYRSYAIAEHIYKNVYGDPQNS
ncbi:MAG TPA: hypothetical protein PKJ62_07215 [Bacteroidia bacterium]|nr:hypothetical protein [Bacteroidia bacterium]HNS11741.1 hypothetical protein [Bacteroidia bacterium]